MYIENDSFSNSCDLMAERERLASAQRAPAIPISPGEMSCFNLRTSKETKMQGNSHLSNPVTQFLDRPQLQEKVRRLLVVSLPEMRDST